MKRMVLLFSGLMALGALAGQEPVVAQVDALKPSWLIVGSDRKAGVSPEQMQAHTRVVSPDGRRVTDTWKGHPTAGADFSVVTEWEPGDEGRLEARIRFTGYAGKEPVSEIQFPAVSVPFEADAKFLWGGSDLGFTFNASQLPAGRYDITRLMSAMQFGAILRPSAESLYFDYRDSDWNIKSVRTRVSSNHVITVSGVYPVPRMDDRPVSSGCIPYASGVKLYRGGWYDATQIYRPWALRQRWAMNRPKTNPLADIDLWVWNRGLIQDVIPPVEQLQKDAPRAKLALDWYWWHSNPYDTDYPFFWPPREGEAAFSAAVKRLSDQGIYSQVYVNGMCWDIDSTQWTDDKAPGLMHTKTGEVRAHAFNKYNHHRLAWMCGEAPAHHDAMSDLVGKLHKAGLTGQYLDMIGNASFDVCWNPAHRHVRNGGHAVTDGYREMLARLGRENPGFPLTTEGATELYMDRCDGSILCNAVSSERMGNAAREFVPLFTAVYHGSYALFGSYALPDSITPWDPKWPDADRWPANEEKPWHELYPDQFYLEMARPLIWGAQPMVCSLRPRHRTDPSFKAIYQFILDTANFYHDHKEDLWAGRMLSPDGFVCAEKEVEFFSRMIFTTKEKSKVLKKKQPCVLHSCWERADGTQTLILCNYTAEPQAWSFRGLSGTIPPRSYEAHPLPRIWDVTAFGARTCDQLVTPQIQNAIDACWKAGGGEVRVPAGVYRVGSLRLRSRVTLHLMSGATLEGSRDPNDYTNYLADAVEPIVEPPVEQRHKSRSAYPYSRWNNALIRAIGATDCAIVGEPHALIDGRNCFDPVGEENYRGPHAINMWYCTNVVLRGYTIKDSANWAHAIQNSANIRCEKVTVLGGHDGFDVRTCDNVRVENCDFICGDDAIAGFDNVNVTIRGCLLDTACSALRFGGTDVLVENCRGVAPAAFGHRWGRNTEMQRLSITDGRKMRHNMHNTFLYYCDYRAVIRKTPGNILLRNCVFENPDCVFALNFDGRHQWCCNRSLSSIRYENCTIAGVCFPTHIHGDAAEPLDFSMKDCTVVAREGAGDKPVLDARNFKRISLENVEFKGYADPRMVTYTPGSVSVVGGTPLREEKAVARRASSTTATEIMATP